jgi:hypothetical protein
MRTDEQERLISLGDNAEELLSNKAFTKTINGLVEATYNAFVNSKPDEAESRERTYNHYRALVDVVNTLNQQVAVRDQIMESEQAGDNSQEEE